MFSAYDKPPTLDVLLTIPKYQLYEFDGTEGFDATNPRIGYITVYKPGQPRRNYAVDLSNGEMSTPTEIDASSSDSEMMLAGQRIPSPPPSLVRRPRTPVYKYKKRPHMGIEPPLYTPNYTPLSHPNSFVYTRSTITFPLWLPTKPIPLQPTPELFSNLPHIPQIKNWREFENLMEYALKKKDSSLIEMASEFADKNLIEIEYIYNPLMLQRLMKYLRGRASVRAQARCLDVLLTYPVISFYRPGSFIRQATDFHRVFAFSHNLVPYTSQNVKLVNPMCNFLGRPVCCRHGYAQMHYEPYYNFLYCLCCDQVICEQCRPFKCFQKVLKFVETSKLVQVYNKKKERNTRYSRESFTAVGPDFPNDQFETLEDSFLFNSN